jgi:hypothetical protein
MDMEFDPSFDRNLCATTTVLPSGSVLSSLKAMQESFGKMPPAPDIGSLVMNPKTADKLFPITKRMLAGDTVSGISTGPFPPAGTPVYRSQLMPETITAEEWLPDAWGPFCDLEKSDEAWARPLGLGRIVKHESPYVVVMMEVEDIAKWLAIPPMLFGDSRFSSFTKYT